MGTDGIASNNGQMFFPPAPVFSNPLCAGTDPDIFFPLSPQERKEVATVRGVPSPLPLRPRADDGDVNPTKVAREMCKVCDHINPCRNYALVNDIKYGVWGGTTEKERRLLNKLMNRTIHGEEAN